MEKTVTTITKDEAFREINETQDYYVNELINLINDPNVGYLKAINFNSLTGTGKTKMMAKLINKLSDKYYFIITTLSRGQLNDQVTENLKKDCDEKNFKVYGTCDYKINSKLQAEDIINNIPKDKECLWLRDEGHIATNRFDQLLINKCYKVINFSATNTHVDINCNFTHTMMLRTVSQNYGTPEDAIKKLLLVKKEHKKVKNYNPCAIFRCVDSKNSLSDIIKLCEENNLKYINITEENFDMSDLCKDDNEYDVIINKFKIVEGIDIRRAHVLYMDNKPTNPATTIQIIGRCRRNALLYRNDIDIFNRKNKKLLENTRKCYVYYNTPDMHINEDESGELMYAFCDCISVEALKPNSVITVENGVLPNGLKIIELQGKSGNFKIKVDKETGFNVVDLRNDFYKKHVCKDIDNLIAVICSHFPLRCLHIFDVYFYTKKDIEKALIKKSKVITSVNYTTMKQEETIKYYFELNTEIKPQKILRLIDKDTLKDIEQNYNYVKSDYNENTRRIIIYYKDLKNLLSYKPYEKIMNDRESAIIGTDLMKCIKTGDNRETWVENSSVTSKLNKYCKFNTFIETKYKTQIEETKNKLFSGKNNFNFDTRCNSCLGYCVEYYSKYLVFGESYIDTFIESAQKEYHTTVINDTIIVRACMLKYKDMMKKAFGNIVDKFIKTISVEKLIEDNYKLFMSTVIELGTKTANFVKKNLNITKEEYDPNLSIQHIKGLADYITEDTILDIKTTNTINKDMVKQVLAYHYLSTKRSDLNIKRVMIYDAVSDKSVEINLNV